MRRRIRRGGGPGGFRCRFVVLGGRLGHGGGALPLDDEPFEGRTHGAGQREQCRELIAHGRPSAAVSIDEHHGSVPDHHGDHQDRGWPGAPDRAEEAVVGPARRQGTEVVGPGLGHRPQRPWLLEQHRSPSQLLGGGPCPPRRLAQSGAALDHKDRSVLDHPADHPQRRVEDLFARRCLLDELEPGGEGQDRGSRLMPGGGQGHAGEGVTDIEFGLGRLTALRGLGGGHGRPVLGHRSHGHRRHRRTLGAAFGPSAGRFRGKPRGGPARGRGDARDGGAVQHRREPIEASREVDAIVSVQGDPEPQLAGHHRLEGEADSSGDLLEVYLCRGATDGDSELGAIAPQRHQATRFGDRPRQGSEGVSADRLEFFG